MKYLSFLLLFLSIFFCCPFWLKVTLGKSSLDMDKVSKDRGFFQFFFTDLCDVFVGMNLELHKLLPNLIALLPMVWAP